MFRTAWIYCAVLLGALSVFVGCTATDPDTDLVRVAEEKADDSIAPSPGVERDPSDIQLSDRQYTFVDLDPAVLGTEGPWYLDLDIEFDVATIWLQSDIECDGCDTDVLAERAQKWDLKIDGRDISLNTNRVDEDTGATLQAVAATDIYVPLQNFNETIELESLIFRPQSASIEPKLQGTQLINGVASFGASFLLRTTRGDRIIYWQLIEADESTQWVRFQVREQVLGVDETFKSPRDLYLRWGQDAIGNEGIMEVDDRGVMRAYFDFDACYDDPGSTSCFDGDPNDGVGGNVVSNEKIPGYDLYFQVRVGTWDEAAMILNGAGSRDEAFNDEYDAAGLYLGLVRSSDPDGERIMEEFWGFSSVEEFNRIASDSEFEMTNFGADGFSAFDQNIWYDVRRNQAGEPIAEANQRIYIFETTEKEGLALQISQTDEQGNIRQIAYEGPTVKQRRQFDIRFRQPDTANIEIKLFDKDIEILDENGMSDMSDKLEKIAVLALSREIVDAETNEPLPDDEFELIDISIQRIDYRSRSPQGNAFASYDDPASGVSYSEAGVVIDEQLSNIMQRAAADGQVYVTEARDEPYKNALAPKVPPSPSNEDRPGACERYESLEGGDFAYLGWNAYRIAARLPGKELISWEVNYRLCRYFNQ